MKVRLFLLVALMAAAVFCLGQSSWDSVEVLLPSGDSTALVWPVFPDRVEDVEGFNALWDALFIVLVMAVGFFKDRLPWLRRISDKELAILAFVVAAVVVVAFARGLTGMNPWGALRLVVDATIATRVYAWGYKSLLELYGHVRPLFGGAGGSGDSDGDGNGAG